jgi:ribosome-binding ATPase
MEGRKLESAIAERLGGIGVGEAAAAKALRETGLSGAKPTEVGADAMLALARAVRRASKPMVVALNKADLATREALDALAATIQGPTVRMSAQAELALMKGVQAGLIDYTPGAPGFTPKGTLTPAQEKGLLYIRDHVLQPLGQTGTTLALETAVLHLLGRVPVFPVEDEAKLTDKEGRVLPDCHLVPPGTTARQLAYRVHTDLGEHFIRAIDCRTHRAIGADHPLKAGDVVKVVAKA